MNIFDMMFGEEPAAGQAITLLTKTVTDFQEASGWRLHQKTPRVWGRQLWLYSLRVLWDRPLQVFKEYIDGQVQHDELKKKMVPGPKLCK